MRSRRPTFKRPSSPLIDQFVDQLESKLRHAMVVAPPARPNRLQRAWDRWTRWMLRPVAHGGLALVMIFFVAASVSGPNTRIVMDVSQPAPVELNNDAYWVEVVQIPDPVPQTYPTVAREPVSRFVVMVEPTPRPPSIPDEIGLSPV
ncbi:MAG TPA: hypothetical protein VJQ57_14330 [Acidimicrobiia bacterium]|nr:hypothetical protein [Acidimicrobiia bacterium]